MKNQSKIIEFYIVFKLIYTHCQKIILILVILKLNKFFGERYENLVCFFIIFDNVNIIIKLDSTIKEANNY